MKVVVLRDFYGESSADQEDLLAKHSSSRLAHRCGTALHYRESAQLRALYSTVGL